MLEILHYPDPVLRQVAKPIATIGREIERLAEQMIETMYAAKGLGLAAPQVGAMVRLVIVDMDVSLQRRDPRVLINPVFQSLSKDKDIDKEGCLSLPGIEAKVKRARHVILKAQDLSGHTVEYAAEGLLARAFQHECDHLDGILFIDKIGAAQRFALRHELARLEEAFAAQARK